MYILYLFCSICLSSISTTSIKVKVLFAILFEYEFIFFSSQTLIPQVMYADAAINDDEDDDLIDPLMEDGTPSTGGGNIM